MKEVIVTVFGTNAPVMSSCCCGPSCNDGCCGSTKTMQEEADSLKEALVQEFGEIISFSYIDVESSEMNNFPEIAKIMNRVKLPLITLNGEPRFHGGISSGMVSEAVSDLAK
ncbi:hypothetical protein SPSYN_02933 [Sporotomaculum syntrophicum]|uniref:Uncharacterized protein n=2 Tax=Sporotomaculum syntrophicum TaxID=182264 RepID=A0A9D2WNI4_9FIRM|nr:hypothetical protein SPSYN_02933 [Sporotomaculum syntrophicum]